MPHRTPTPVSQALFFLACALASAEEAVLVKPEAVLVPGWPADAPPGAKRLIFIRHAEGARAAPQNPPRPLPRRPVLGARRTAGWHNKHAREMPNYLVDNLGLTEAYWDARLTPEGELQAGLLSVSLAPLTRRSPAQLREAQPWNQYTTFEHTERTPETQRTRATRTSRRTSRVNPSAGLHTSHALLLARPPPHTRTPPRLESCLLTLHDPHR